MPDRLKSASVWITARSAARSAAKSVAKSVPGLAGVARWTLLLFRPARRARERILREQPHQLYQPGGRTAFDRHPELFAALRDALAGVPRPRILSFGCSTGEEILTLKSYLPKAELAGIDINDHRLSQARRKVRDRSIRFWVAGSIGDTDAGTFDAITCLNVLHRPQTLHQWPADPTPYLSFASFERAVLDLDRALRPGGILVLDHMSFNFTDTAVAGNYAAIVTAITPGEPIKRYDRSNQPILVPLGQQASLWRKLS